MERYTSKIGDNAALILSPEESQWSISGKNQTITISGDAINKFAQYEELEAHLQTIFGETYTLEDVVDGLEMQLTEPDKQRPLYARILTYEDADKWDEYKHTNKTNDNSMQCND
mgnify:CR=1 FL=1